MLPFRSFYGFESWLDHSGYNPNPNILTNSLMKPTNLDGGKSILTSASTADINTKSTEACKSHREAERRRRQRINAHLSTLRTLLPNTPKSDKASLLAEVVQHVKDLRRQADDVARQLDGDLSLTGSDPTWPFPGESDQANVTCDCDGGLMKATVCCEDRPNLNRDIARAIRSVRAMAVRAEMMTVGGRTKSVVVIQWVGEEEKEEEVEALERALTAVVENRALVSSGLGRKRSRPCCEL